MGKIKNLILNIYMGIFITFVIITASGGILWGIIKRPYFSISVLFLTIVFLYLLFQRKFKDITNYDKKIFLVIIMGIILRLGYFYLMGTEQISDFLNPTRFYFHLLERGEYSEYVYLLKRLDNFQKYYALFPAWGTYMIILNKVYTIFGYSKNIVLYLNLILFTLTSIILYSGVKLVFNKKIAFFSSCVFIFYPQLIMWISINTPDHFVILLTSLIIFLYGLYLKERSNKKVFIVLFLLFLVSSLINLFKPLSVLFLLIYIFSEIVNYCNFNEYKINLKYIIFSVVSFLLISNFINNYSQRSIEGIIKTKVQQGTSYYILWGYSTDKNGNWKADACKNEIETVEKESKTFEEQLSKMDLIAKQTIRKNIKLFPKIWIQKLAYLFSSENWAISWTNTSLDSNKQDFIKKIETEIGIILTIFNSFIMYMMSFGVLKKNKMTNILSMSWLGYMMFLVVASVQTRYRCVFYLYQCILAVNGYEVMKEKIKVLKEKKCKILKFQ